MMEELKLASVGGFKSKHDDSIDTISMLASMKAWKPSEESTQLTWEDGNIWDQKVDDGWGDSGLNSYLP